MVFKTSCGECATSACRGDSENTATTAARKNSCCITISFPYKYVIFQTASVRDSQRLFHATPSPRTTVMASKSAPNVGFQRVWRTSSVPASNTMEAAAATISVEAVGRNVHRAPTNRRPALKRVHPERRPQTTGNQEHQEYRRVSPGRQPRPCRRGVAPQNTPVGAVSSLTTTAKNRRP